MSTYLLQSLHGKSSPSPEAADRFEAGRAGLCDERAGLCDDRAGLYVSRDTGLAGLCVDRAGLYVSRDAGLAGLYV